MRTKEKVGAFALVVFALLAFMAVAFGVGYLLGKLLL